MYFHTADLATESTHVTRLFLRNVISVNLAAFLSCTGIKLMTYTLLLK